MDSNEDISSIPDPNSATVITIESEVKQPAAEQQQRKEGLATKVRQKIDAAGKRIQGVRPRKVSVPDLSNLTEQSQELIMRTVASIRFEDSRQMVDALDESRDLLRDSLEEFKREQREYRGQVEAIMKNKQVLIQRQKENLIPISIFRRQKQDVEGLADLRPNSSINPTYQAYFEALLTPNQTDQHPSDRAAVIKYIRRRERRRRADENRQTYELSDDILEKQTAVLMEKMEGMDVKLEHERQRQTDRIRVKMNEKKANAQNVIAANGILDQAAEADLVRQRLEQTHREKVEARLSAVRRQQNRTPTSIIHVQSQGADDSDSSWTGEQLKTSKKSAQVLKGDRSATLSTNRNAGDTLTNVHI